MRKAGLEGVRSGEQGQAAHAGSAQVAQPGVFRLTQLHQNRQAPSVRKLRMQGSPMYQCLLTTHDQHIFR